MRYREIQPGFPLSQTVQCFWILEDDTVDHHGVVERVVPDGSMELIVHYGDPFQREIDGVRSVGIARGIVAGQCTRAVCLRRQGRVGMIAARFHPGTAGSILRGPMHELTDQIVALESLDAPSSEELVDRIQSAIDDDQRLALLQRWLLRAQMAPARDHAGIAEATRRIRASRGQVDIAALARELVLSTRSLERAFARHVGLTPKRFARIVRFRQVFDALARVKDWTWADVALRCGYTDQAHLVHEFREFSGLPPARLLRERGDIGACLVSQPLR